VESRRVLFKLATCIMLALSEEGIKIIKGNVPIFEKVAF
jgi:hypothetical protein